MGLFRRKSKDPFAAARRRDRRARGDTGVTGFDDLPESRIHIEVNKNACFTEADRAWLERDPGEEIRRNKR